jgi:hypothetical protein
LNQELIQAEKGRIIAEITFQKGIGNVGSTDGVLGNTFVQKMKERQAELQTEYEKNLDIYKPDYPKMVQLRQQINETNNEILAESNKFSKNLQLNYESSKKQEDEIRKLLDNSSKKYQTYLSNMNTFNELKRDLDVEKTLYDSLLTRLKQIDVAGGVNFNNISILEKASIPQFAYSPNYMVNLIMGGVIAVLLGVSIAGIVDFRDGRIKSNDDILALPMRKRALLEKIERGMLTRAGSGDAQLLPSRNMIATLQSVREGRMRVISLLALGRDEKHDAFVLNLMNFFLKKKLKVILLAMDEDHVFLQKQFRVQPADEFFVSEVPLPVLVSRTDREGLSVTMLNADEIFPVLGRGNNQFGSLMEALANSYDIVLLMSTDVGKHPEIIPELGVSDMILVNVLKRKTRLSELERLAERLDKLPNGDFCILHDL